MKTSKIQISLFIEEKSTLSQEDSHVSHIVKPGKDLEKQMSAICGQKCLELFNRFNHVGLWQRTFSELLIGTMEWYSMKCKLIWKMKGTASNRLYFQLQVSMPHTEDTGHGLLPTPTTQEPTAICEITETGRKKSKKGKQSYSLNLGRMAKMNLLPTPTAGDSPEKNTGKRNQDGLQKRAVQMTGKTSQLHPQYLAEMMGFPTNWTVLPFQNGEMNQ